jgi:Leucine-rich repeat (LRR) protein
VLSCDRIRDLAPLAAATSLDRLWVQQCAELCDLSALASMTWLTRLAINHNPKVADFRPIAALPNLEQLDLFGNDVPAALRGRHVGRDAIAAIQRRILEN